MKEPKKDLAIRVPNGDSGFRLVASRGRASLTLHRDPGIGEEIFQFMNMTEDEVGCLRKLLNTYFE